MCDKYPTLSQKFAVLGAPLTTEKQWRRLRGYKELAKVIDGVRLIDGIEEGTPTPLASAA